MKNFMRKLKTVLTYRIHFPLVLLALILADDIEDLIIHVMGLLK